MGRFTVLVLVLVLSAACGGSSSHAGGDAPGPDAPDLDAPPADASVDAPADAWAPMGPCAGTPLLPDVPLVRTPTYPRTTTIGDISGDGKADLLVPTENGLSIVLGRGDGTFAAPINMTPRLVSPAIGDVDGDGDLDIVAASTTTSELFVIKNAGGGTFAVPAKYPTPPSPFMVALGDIDGDGDLDAALTEGSTTVTVMHGDGTGGFGAPTNYTGGIDPVALTIADVDGNGSSDIVLADRGDGNIAIFHNSGTGTFGSVDLQSAGAAVTAAAFADLDGDGKLDVAAAQTGAGTRVLRGNGNGTFQLPLLVSSVEATSVAVGDVDGDGKRDVLALAADQLILVPGTATGFGSARSFPSEAYAVHVATGAIDANGRADVAITMRNGNAVAVLLDHGGALRVDPTAAVSPEAALAIAAGDLDGDGTLDLAAVIGSTTGGSVEIFTGDGQGRFMRTMTFPAREGKSIQLRDLDGDGRLDVLSPAGIHYNKPTGWTHWEPDIGSIEGYSTSDVGDLNGDGLLDIVFGNDYGYRVVLATPTGWGAYTPTAALYDNVRSLRDMNGDGKLDLISAADLNSTAKLRLGNGDGTFQNPPLTIPGAVAADVNGDGKLDLAGPLGASLGNGDATFQPILPYTIEPVLASARVADVDRDGKLDIVFLRNRGDIQLLRGHGDGTFAPPLGYSTQGQRFDLTLVDVDGNGALDVALGGPRWLSVMQQVGCVP